MNKDFYINRWLTAEGQKTREYIVSHLIETGSIGSSSIVSSIDGYEAEDYNLDLRGIDLSELKFPKLNFCFARLDFVNLSNCRTEMALVNGSSIVEANFKGFVFGEGQFHECIANRACFDEVKARQLRFWGANLDGASFKFVECEKASFEKANLKDTDFSNAIINQ